MKGRSRVRAAECVTAAAKTGVPGEASVAAASRMTASAMLRP